MLNFQIIENNILLHILLQHEYFFVDLVFRLKLYALKKLKKTYLSINIIPF